MPSARSLIAAIALALPVARAAPGGDLPPATFRLDPVRLQRGEELAGRDDLAVVHGNYRYVFADEAARDAFVADPARYAIRMGGACARMGPLSGRGSVDLWAVRDEALFLFASEACRRTFLADPAARLERDDPAPAVDDAARARGAALLARVVDALGGARALDAADSLVLEEVREQEDSGRTYEVGHAWRVRLPLARGARLESWWDPGYRRGDVLASDAFTVGDDGTRPLDGEQRRALERLASRLPIALLRERGRPDFTAAWVGDETLDGRTAARLQLALPGLVTTLIVDAASGELLGQEHTGRGPDATLGTLRLRFTRTVEAGGLKVPAAWSVTFGGRPADDLARDWTRVEVGAPLDDALFAR